MSEQANPQLTLLTTLLQLEKEARHAESLIEMGFVAVNETHRLLQYSQAVLWSFDKLGRIKVKAVSGISEPEQNAPFVRWLERLIRHRYKLSQKEQVLKLHTFTRQDIPPHFIEKNPEWVYEHILWAPLVHPRYGLQGGLLFMRRQSWRDGELILLERLNDAYGHAWGVLQGRRPSPAKSRLRRIVTLVVIAVLGAALFLQVHESVLSPATVIAAKPLVVSAPLNGVVKTIHVQPNSTVKTEQPLFSLNDTEQRNNYLITQEKLAVVRAELLSAEQKAFSDRESKGDVALLRAKLKQSEAELQYVADLLSRMEVRAERDGIAVFADPNDWLGKPVSVGEKVMTLADPAYTEIEIQVVVADAINLLPGSRVRLFLNTDPTHPLEAELYQAAYEAEPLPDGILAFRVKARFVKEEVSPRIGLKGTAKIYGKEVPLYYYLFRRPWATLRQWVGM